MGKFGEVLKGLLAANPHIDRATLAKAIGGGRSTTYAYTSENPARAVLPEPEKIEKIARLFGVPVKPLLEAALADKNPVFARHMVTTPPNDAPPGAVPVRYIPLISRVPAGNPADWTDLEYPVGVAEEYVAVPELDDVGAFALRISGDSMVPSLMDGDIVVVSPGAVVKAGDFALVRLGGDGDHKVAVRQVYFDDESSVRAEPVNREYRGVVYARTELTGLWRIVLRISKV